MEARPALHLSRDLSQPGVVELDGTAAAGADDVMVMGGFTGDVGVLAAGQVQALHQSQVGEQFQRPEDRRAADRETALRGVVHQFARGEMALSGRNQLGDRAARLRAADTGLGQGVQEG